MGVTVKDVPAKEFIEQFAKHLKKGNKIKMPEVSTEQKIIDAQKRVDSSNKILIIITIVGHLLQDLLCQGSRPL